MKNLVLESVFLAPIMLFIAVTIVAYFTIILSVYSQLF